MTTDSNAGSNPQSVQIPADHAILHGDLILPEGARGVVVFAHGSGSSRHSPRNRNVARFLNEAGIATLLMDLLSAEEEAVDRQTQHMRFNVPLLSKRLNAALVWLAQQPSSRDLRVGFFGASTGAGAALISASVYPERVGAVVSRGGRVDLAGKALPLVRAPTLMIVGGEDAPVIAMNREALAKMTTEAQLDIIPGATHLFEEPGALDEVARLATRWFARTLNAAP